ncbi:MAG TPA: cation:proton antiporter [Gemmatimonadota bacterium]|nr:cation:proton antiporter [Gemmatimonadota bacterium]
MTAVKEPEGPQSRRGLAVYYGGLLLAAAVVFLLVRSYGETLTPGVPASPATAPHAAPGVDALPHILFVLGAVVLIGRALARLLAPLRQPPVIGEVLAGILLGPSLLGPDLAARILPPETSSALAVVAQLGVILFMFLIGLEFDFGFLRRRAHAAVAISHAGIVVPFLLGATLAIGLYPRLATEGVRFTTFALFLGVAMAITAFPVLARILTDRGLERTPLGILALGVAAVDDVTAWCLLAIVLGLARAEVGGTALVVGGALAFIAIMVFGARPLLARLSARGPDRLGEGSVAAVFVALFACALIADRIGIHAIFGAFLLGAVMPHEGPVARFFERRLRLAVTVFLLPAFFAYTGMRTRIDLMSGGEAWAICGLIVLVATLGKLGGVFMAARAAGVERREAAGLGALMNARGLMELIVLNIGLEMGVISPVLFSMMVVMAIVTTMSSAPLLWLFLGDPKRPAPESARRAAARSPD